MAEVQVKSQASLYELAQLYCERGDLLIALEKLKEAAATYRSQQDFANFLKCQNMLLRIYAELEDHKAINSTKELLQDLVIKEELELSSKTYYSLALCASYKRQHKVAQEYLEKALALALEKDSKEDICYAIHGLALVYYAQKRYEDALKEVYNLQVFFQLLPLPELMLSSRILNGLIVRDMGQKEQALDIFWQCYDIVKSQKNLYTYLHLLYSMGSTYQDMGHHDLARIYLMLAKRSIDPENLRYLSRRVDARLAAMGDADQSDYDLVFDRSSNSLIERKKGKIDFKNQFILLDLLRLFLRNPGEVHSKEALVKKVWRQDYDPAVHDNKIYVTIKRLRKMIEPDYDKPKYIFRAKNGYYLSKNTKVLFQAEGTQ